jgi:hypothetical protein
MCHKQRARKRVEKMDLKKFIEGKEKIGQNRRNKLK